MLASNLSANPNKSLSENRTSEKTMTVKEVSENLGISKDTVLNCIKRIMPNKMQHGKTTYLNEKEIALISKELKTNNKVVEQLTVEAASTVKNTTTELEILANYKAATDAYVLMLERKNEEKNRLLEQQKPKVEVYDRICNAENLKSVDQVADILGFGRNNFFSIMRGKGIFFYSKDADGRKTNLPKREYIDRGYFVTKEEPFTRGEKNVLYTKIYVTGKGETWLAKKIKD